MKSNRVRFSSRMHWWFYSILGVLFFSGVVWLVVHYYFERQNEFDGQYSSLQPWLLRIHGAAAMGSLLMLGFLIPRHMQRAWEQQRNLVTAVVIVSLCLAMIVSGYGLYYCGSETLRSWISGFHSAAGCLLPLVLVWHIISGRKQRTRAHSA